MGKSYIWQIWQWGVLLAAICLASTPAAASWPGTISLLPGESVERIDQQAVYLLAGEGRVLTAEEALGALKAGEFSARIPAESDGSLRDRNLWMAITLTNPAPAGEADLRRVLGLGGIFIDFPLVYLVGGESAPEEILGTHVGPGKPLVSRYFTYLRTQSFDMPPGETRTVLINTHVNDRPTMGVFREGELGSRQIIATLIKASFTLTLLIIGIVLALVSILNRRWMGFLVAVGFGFVMIHVDTSLYSTAFSDTPETGRMIWEAMTLGLIFYVYYLALYAFRSALRLDRSKIWLVIALLLPTPLVWIAAASDDTTDILWAYYLALFVLAVIIGAKLDIERNLRRLTMSVMLLCVFAAIAVEPYYLGRTLPDLTIEYIRDAIRLTAGFSMLIVVLVDVRRTGAERRRLAQERLEAAEAQADTDRRLLEMERSYSRARESAARRKQQLAAASHDIRQPLLGLRSALASEADSLSQGLQGRLTDAIDYLEHLTEEYSDREKAVASFEQGESYSLDLITRAVSDMFGAEAEAAGIAFVTESRDCMTKVPALALIRATSNLVANALRHAGATRISVSVLHDRGCTIEVADNGIGMDAPTLASVQQRGAKGAESSGDGLGLAIIHELARRHGFRFVLESTPGKGTTARLDLAGA